MIVSSVDSSQKTSQVKFRHFCAANEGRRYVSNSARRP
jgi:hypothetical protein